MGAVAPAGDEAVTPIVFTTEDLPVGQRLDAWNAAFGTLNTISLPQGDPCEATGAWSENWLLGGGMVLSSTRVSPTRFTRDPARARRDGLDHWVLRVMRRGESRLQHPGFTAALLPGELLLFSVQEAWNTEWTAAEWVSLCIPRDTHPQLSAGLGALARGPLRGAGAGLLADILLALPGRLASSRAAEVPVLADALRAAVSTCLLSGTPREAIVAATTELRKERVRQAIRRNVGSVRLTPTRLAAAAGLSRSALYRMFEAEGGVARHIRDVRLSLVHAGLRDPAMAGQSIAKLAAAHGFADPSTFSRAFHRAYGMAAREVRASGLPGPAPPRPHPAGAPPVPSGLPDMAARLYGHAPRAGGREAPVMPPCAPHAEARPAPAPRSGHGAGSGGSAGSPPDRASSAGG